MNQNATLLMSEIFRDGPDWLITADKHPQEIDPDSYQTLTVHVGGTDNLDRVVPHHAVPIPITNTHFYTAENPHHDHADHFTLREATAVYTFEGDIHVAYHTPDGTVYEKVYDPKHQRWTENSYQQDTGLLQEIEDNPDEVVIWVHPDTVALCHDCNDPNGWKNPPNERYCTNCGSTDLHMERDPQDLNADLYPNGGDTQ